MARKPNRRLARIKLSARAALLSSPNELHKAHRLHASGTGAHRNKKRYQRRAKYRRDYGAE